MIIISHSHEEGTVLSGSSKGDGAYELVKLHGFRYSRNVGIYIRGSRDKDAQQWRIDAAVETLRSNGFEVTVDIDDQWRPAAEREADRADRVDERAERLDDRAAAAGRRRDARQDAANRTLDAIPFGQPMLVGHHSYKADRNRRERAWSNMDKALEEDRYASSLADRAHGSRSNEDAKQGSRAILRRIERLQADLRVWQRRLDESTTDDYRQRAQRQIDRLNEDIAHQEGKIGERADSGEFVPWTGEHFCKGDWVRVGGYNWHQVTRINRKTVSVTSDGWPSTVPYHEIHGRRRDGWQIDTPHGDPWPVSLAVKVSRWMHTSRQARISQPYDDASRRLHTHAGFATRLVHGLSLSAAEAEVEAFWPLDTDDDATAIQRQLCAAYLDVFDRLQAGELASGIAATLPSTEFTPRWSIPDGDGKPMHPQDLRPGDLVKGVWQNGYSGRDLWRHFAGPVANVADIERRREAGDFVTVTLEDGSSKKFGTHQWLAVFPVEGGEQR